MHVLARVCHWVMTDLELDSIFNIVYCTLSWRLSFGLGGALGFFDITFDICNNK